MPFRFPAATTVLALLVVLAGITACADSPAPSAEPVAEATEPGESEQPEEHVTDGPASQDEDREDPDDERDAEPGADERPDPAEVGANELGLVPVLMFHRLLEDGGGDYDLTPEQFRAELERLYEEGYRPIRLKDLVRGRIDVPAGTTPVVLTFDDSTREQAALADGEIAGDTAIGMLIEFASSRPDFDAVGSLYVNAYPFGGGHDSDDILRALHGLGFELGNHTHAHHRLDRLSADEVRRELALGKRVVTDVVGDAEVVTMALPLGIWPEARDLVHEGDWEGTAYRHEGILLVGADPAPSPFHAHFDPLAIPRIRAEPWDGGEPTYTSGFWLDWLADNPERRYVSDGDPETISFPAELADVLAPAYAERANPYQH